MKNIYIILSIIAVLCSCKKAEQITPSSITGQSNQLKQLRFKHSTVSSVISVNFYYDSTKRVTRIEQYIKDSARLDSTIMISMDFTYAANYYQPIRAKVYDNGETIFHILKYDSQNNVISDSMSRIYNQGNIPSVNTFQYFGEVVLTRMGEENSNNVRLLDSSVFSNGNLLFSKQYIGTHNYRDDSSISVFQYNSTLNPLSILNIAKVYPSLNNGIDPFIFLGLTFSKNNMISRIGYYHSFVENYSNTFNINPNNGMPANCTFLRPGWIGKMDFYYY